MKKFIKGSTVFERTFKVLRGKDLRKHEGIQPPGFLTGREEFAMEEGERISRRKAPFCESPPPSLVGGLPVIDGVVLA
ncbi:MAG: hypothetical protein ACLQU4_00005 [Limisphaerales bacterium]